MAEHYDHPERIYRYSYQGENNSLVDRLLVYWWKLAIKAVPERMSANLLSMLGNAGSWLAFGLMIAAGASRTAPSAWLFILAGLGMCFYHTLDCLDGIQARRIKAAGPLGEFVDHWFDSFNVFFIGLGTIAAFPSIPLWLAVPVVLLSVLVDWAALKEVTITNKLVFGPLSTEEGIVLYILFIFSIPFFGYSFMAEPLPGLGLPPAALAALITGLGYLGTLAGTLKRIHFNGIKALCTELLLLAPLGLWAALAPALGYSRGWSIAALAALGFSGSRHVGDLLRNRLFGLRLPRAYFDMTAISVALAVVCLASTLKPGFPLWTGPALVVASLGSSAIALFLQFFRAVARVRECLGYGLFYVAPLDEAQKTVAAPNSTSI